MHSVPWALALGCFATAALPLLPPPSSAAILLLVCLLLRPWRHRRRIPLCVCLAGLVWGLGWAHWQMHHRLPQHLDRQDYVVTGAVVSLPRVDDIVSTDEASPPPLKQLRLSWYGEQRPRAGQRWRLKVRLRSPRNFANPGGFDYSGWLLSRGISATGYVRESPGNRQLGRLPGFRLPALRQAVLDRIDEQAATPAVRGFMAALVLGENGLIPPQLFQRLVDTGTVHLVVVSGLHVGMVATLALVPGLLIGRVGAALGSPVPAPVVASTVALLSAMAYGFLAGMGLPVQRALIMTGAALTAVWLRRRIPLTAVFAAAVAGVSLVDPLAVTRAGFWFSFSAVAALLLWFQPRPSPPRWSRLPLSQVVVFAALVAPLVLFQGELSPWSIPINLVAIPWVGIGIVPLCLAGALTQWWPPVGDILWRAASWQLQWLVDALVGLEALPPARWQPVAGADPGFVAPLVLSALLLLSPGGLGLRRLGLTLAIGLWFARPAPAPDLSVAALDVGQGLAVVVRVGERTLIYDTGARFSRRFDAGSAILAPFLRQRGVDKLETLVISHGDNDHAGGAAGLVQYYPPERLISGTSPVPEPAGAVPCARMRGWQWGQVHFRFLWPPPGRAGRDNDISCVLAIESARARILLPGDIESGVERQLVKEGVLGGAGWDLVVAPHHGSRTSSTPAFVDAVRPDHVLFSAGFNHHFGHPHTEVVRRYREQGSRLWFTARSGAVTFRWDPRGGLRVRAYRDEARRYWRVAPKQGSGSEMW